MGTDVLATQGARASATMILTMLNQDNLVPTCTGPGLIELNPVLSSNPQVNNRTIVFNMMTPHGSHSAYWYGMESSSAQGQY